MVLDDESGHLSDGGGDPSEPPTKRSRTLEEGQSGRGSAGTGRVHLYLQHLYWLHSSH